jgi:xylulokinase
VILGIDVGTQSLKAVVLGPELELLGQAASGYQPAFPRPGWAEQDPRLWEDALAPTIARALEAAGLKPDAVAALGVAGQLDGCIAVDEACRPLAPCLIWMDRRAAAELAGAELAGIDAEALRRTTGVMLDATHMAAKIRWLERHLEDARPARYHQPVSYLVARLTGAHVFDHGHASTTMLYGLEEGGFDPALLAAFGIDAAELPELAEAASLAGTLTAEGAAMTGLPAGLPVAVGTGDDFSTPLGGGLVAPGRFACVLGTAEVVGALHPAPLVDPGGLVETHGYPAGGYFIENPGWLSGGALAWFRETFGIESFAALDSLAAAVPPGAEGLTFLPALSGAMAPEWYAGARGCFYGLTPAHGAGHMARAVLEGCAFAMRDVAERLVELGVALDSILLLGGGAKSDLWAGIRADLTGIRADLTGLPVERPAVADTSPLGAAMLAAVAAGLQPDLTACARLLGGGSATIAPDPGKRAAYDAAYGAYRRLFDSLRPLFETEAGEGGP